jgi:hypothetical protein
VGDWPLISEPELRARLALTDEEFRAFLTTFARSIGTRELTDEIYTRALGYPWERPQGSYLLTGDTVERLGDLPAGAIHELREARWPLLAFGSNAAPERLTLKFGHLATEQRRLLVTTGDLHGFDVGVSAHPSMYGSMPATIFPSDGTVVRAAVLWVTAEQLTALTWTELSYSLGRLDGIRFDCDASGTPPIDRVYAFVSRLGALQVDGDVVALAAVPAAGRQAPAYTQEQLLDHLAVRVLGPGSTARALVTLLMEDFGGSAATIGPMLQTSALPFDSPHWTPYPGPEALSAGDAATARGAREAR